MAKSYKEDGRPSFQFYPDDWVSEPGLLLSSLAAQGLWIRMLCYMWKGNPRGFLVANGKQIDSKSLAKLCGESEEYIKPLLDELAENKVYSINEEGIIYSRRMCREEEIRKIRAIAGQQGGFSKAGKYQKGSKKLAKVWQKSGKTLANDIAKSWQAAEEGVGIGVEVEEGIGEEIEVEKEEKKGERVQRGGKGKNPDIKLFIDWYSSQYQKRFDKKYIISGAKEGSLVKRLLSYLTIEQLKEITINFFEAEDDFIIHSGYTIGVFYSQINKLQLTKGKTLDKKTISHIREYQKIASREGWLDD